MNELIEVDRCSSCWRNLGTDSASPLPVAFPAGPALSDDTESVIRVPSLTLAS